jgi:hypothetical protein
MYDNAAGESLHHGAASSKADKNTPRSSDATRDDRPASPTLRAREPTWGELDYVPTDTHKRKDFLTFFSA